MAIDSNWDIVIVGGGPAGSSSAIHLARQGFSVLLLEKEKFPRPHVGESLVPFCYHLLDELDVLNTLKKNAVRKPGVAFISSDGQYESTYWFKNLIKDSSYLSFHVLREYFDKLLLDKAKEVGATVLEETKVSRVNFVSDDKVVVETKGKNEKIFNCRFLIDATGQDSFLSSQMKTKKKNDNLDRIAFLSHWKDVDMSYGLDKGLLKIVYTDQSKKGWMGIQAVGNNRVSISFVCDFAYVRKTKKNYENDENWKEKFYHDELQKAAYTRKILKNASRIQSVIPVGNYSYSVTQRYGKNFALIGDSAGFLDPIFATGVYIALSMSKMVSQAVGTYLNNQEEFHLVDKAYEQHSGAYHMLTKFINNFYNPDFIDLAQLQSKIDRGDESFARHKIAFEILHYLMAGDFFKEYERYSNFIDFLNSPKQLDRYLYMVINKSENESDFSTENVKIFPSQNV